MSDIDKVDSKTSRVKFDGVLIDRPKT